LIKSRVKMGCAKTAAISISCANFDVDI